MHYALADAGPGTIDLWDLAEADDKQDIEGWRAPFDGVSVTSPEVKLSKRIQAEIKALVEGGCGRDVDTVIVDGKVLVQGGRTTRVDENEVYAKAREVTERYWSQVPGWRWDGATVERISPPAFPMHRAR